MESKIRQKLMLQQSQREQIAFKEMRKEAEKEEEAAFRETMLAKFAEDDRIEQMNAQKRRMKQLEHRRAVEKLIEERKQQHLTAMVMTCSVGQILKINRPLMFHMLEHGHTGVKWTLHVENTLL